MKERIQPADFPLIDRQRPVNDCVPDVVFLRESLEVILPWRANEFGGYGMHRGNYRRREVWRLLLRKEVAGFAKIR